VRLSGWCHRIRDHGGLLFIDLRDHYGITQLVADPDSTGIQAGGEAPPNSSSRIDGRSEASRGTLPDLADRCVDSIRVELLRLLECSGVRSATSCVMP